jgi:PAS domain S-box-containing protein
MVSGNLSDVGIITQLNQGACRVFGYTYNELIGQTVEKLMPPIYAKHHSKILRTAL